MAKEKVNLRDKLRSYKLEFDLLQEIPCSKEENKEYEKLLNNGEPLPDGVYSCVDADGTTSKTEFYTIYESDLSESEKIEYLTYKKLSLLKTIKNCVVFFTILIVIGLVAGFLLTMSAF